MKLSKNTFKPSFKAKIACEALRESKSINELASENGVHPGQVTGWKKILVSNSKMLFERKNAKARRDDEDLAELQRIVGEQAIMLAWYKKKLGMAN